MFFSIWTCDSEKCLSPPLQAGDWRRPLGSTDRHHDTPGAGKPTARGSWTLKTWGIWRTLTRWDMGTRWETRQKTDGNHDFDQIKYGKRWNLANNSGEVTHFYQFTQVKSCKIREWPKHHQKNTTELGQKDGSSSVVKLCISSCLHTDNVQQTTKKVCIIHKKYDVKRVDSNPG